MSYVEAYISPIITAKKDIYINIAEIASKVFIEHGALSYNECWGLDVPDGVLSMPKAVDLHEDETVCFTWIIWPSKELRDAGMEKVSTDPRLQPDVLENPFDATRMIFGGFERVVSI